MSHFQMRVLYSLVLWIIYSHAMFDYIFRSALGGGDIPSHEIGKKKEEQLIFVFHHSAPGGELYQTEQKQLRAILTLPCFLQTKLVETNSAN